MNVFGFIPARGGSKRFPRKNLSLLGGRPLLAWTLEAARASGVFSTIALSTDDAEISAIGGALGVRVIERPAALGADDVTVVDVLLATLDELEAGGERFDAAYVLMPTSPFRSAATIVRAFEAFRAGGASALISVMPQEYPPEWTLEIEGGWLRARDAERYVKPRVELTASFRGDGAHLIAAVETLRRNREFLGTETIAFRSPDAERIDIDTPRDLAFAEFLLRDVPLVDSSAPADNRG
jgi:CMP-N-acetylneuraminic acid synthetase